MLYAYAREKPRSKAQGPCWCYWAASFQRDWEEPREALHNLPASPAAAAASPCGWHPCPPRQDWAEISQPSKGQEGPWAPCHAGCTPAQRATLRRSGTSPQRRTPRWGVAGWEKPRWPWLRHGSSLWACGHMLFFWGIRSYLFIAIIHHPDRQSSLSSQMSWPRGYHEKKPHRPSVSSFNSPRTPCVQHLLVSGSIRQHPQSCCPAKTFSFHGRAIFPPLFPSAYTNKRK